MSERPAHFLRTIRIERFGAMENRTVGPFEPGINVVFGPNESGKTTTATFIGGVLFGWPDARGARNDYRPVGAERAGTLVFAPTIPGEEEVRCTRVRNAEGIKPDPEPSLLSDIDRETFQTVFLLDSDELRRMGRTTDVTAHLLTAGSGTQVSPAQASSKVDDAIARAFSRSANAPNSIPNLQRSLAKAREDMAAASDKAAELEREDREFSQLKEAREKLSASIARLNGQIRAIAAERERIAHAGAQRERAREDLRKLDEQRAALDADRDALEQRRTGRFPLLDPVEERTLREAIEDAADEHRRLEHALSLADQDLLASQALLDAVRESGAERLTPSHKMRKRTVQSVLSVVLPLLFAGMGAFVFMHGRSIGSLSVTALGAMLVLFAVAMACAALVMLIRPNSVEERVSNQLADAELVVQKDAKKKEACEAALRAHADKTARFLEDEGLGDARGSLHRARALLDEAGDARAEATVLDQRGQAISSQRSQLLRSIERAEEEKREALAALGESGDVTAEELDERLVRRTEQRDAQMRANETANQRYGELAQILSNARKGKDFDLIKLEHSQLKSRYGDALEDLARLLLAKRLLESSITAWEGKSQPAVYQRASELFADMTEGAWTQIRLTAAGSLVVVDAEERTRGPELLSLGTLQQLYLALRVALLLTATNVGRDIPVLCDDILVNFDSGRRVGAARALAALAKQRQVILFTCHEEVVDLMQTADPAANVVRL